MQIMPIQVNQTVNRTNNPQFKKAYPVVHWVAESNSSYAPVVSAELTEKLQRILVNILNKSRRLKPDGAAKNAVAYISRVDEDYRNNDIVRSYYDQAGGFNKTFNKFMPLSYLITGGDAHVFNEKFGKPIGRAKASAPMLNGKPLSAEVQQARSNYSVGGWTFVNDKKKGIYDKNGVEYSLHTKFETVRNKKTGEIKGYNLVGIKFCPQEGPENPFVKAGYSIE